MGYLGPNFDIRGDDADHDNGDSDDDHDDNVDDKEGYLGPNFDIRGDDDWYDYHDVDDEVGHHGIGSGIRLTKKDALLIFWEN